MGQSYKDWLDKLHLPYGVSNLDSIFDWSKPYSLVYGIQAILPIEISISSLRVIAKSHILESEWVKARYEELVMMDERILQALHDIQLY